MLSEVMNYYSFIRDFKGAGYFETEHHQQIGVHAKPGEAAKQHF